MGLYYNGKKVRNLYYNGKCITRLALGKEMTRLVEGDDFVRAEWLCWNGAAYLDTQIIPQSGDNIYIDCLFPSHPPYTNTGLVVANGDSSQISVVTGGAWFNNIPKSQFLITTKNNNASSAYTEFHSNVTTDVRMQCFISVSVNNPPQIQLTINNTQIVGNTTGDNYMSVMPNAAYVIGKYNNNIGLGMGKLHNVKINSADFTPCRLLRPIPAALDANGIARNAGECGMYDTVSGKFYGNVAESGSFTVSDN